MRPAAARQIMMLSVVKRSSLPVKFWLFENYLSPTFKASTEAMAQEYGFEVAFVSYKWPSWLRQQTSKQRIIWGYKILFLDVMFPLSVRRIIYIDADQAADRPAAATRKRAAPLHASR